MSKPNAAIQSHLEVRRLDAALYPALRAFFHDLHAAGVDEHFHPHPFDDAQARQICDHGGQDLYYGLVQADRIVGYGMLRGWDGGFEVPSLGIAIHPRARGAHLGKMLMLFLHAAARLRGAPRIRLKVYPENTVALAMYRELGYEFGPVESGQLVGTLEL